MDPVIVTEFALSELHTGVRARVRHLCQALCVDEKEVVSIHPGRRGAVSLAQRLRHSAARSVLQRRRDERLVVVGLGSPPMFRLASELSRAGFDVCLDVCDSTWGQFRSRVRSIRPKQAVVGLWMLIQHIGLPKNLTLSYIDEVELEADRLLNGSRLTAVFRPLAPVDLALLGEVRRPVKRISLAGDFSSFHNAAGLRLLVEAYRASEANVPITLFGPVRPRIDLPHGMRYVGWADDISEIYAGDTAIYVSNIRGTGVPNKLIEAVEARRPVIVHESSTRHSPEGYDCFIFEDRDDLEAILIKISEEARDE